MPYYKKYIFVKRKSFFPYYLLLSIPATDTMNPITTNAPIQTAETINGVEKLVASIAVITFEIVYNCSAIKRQPAPI